MPGPSTEGCGCTSGLSLPKVLRSLVYPVILVLVGYAGFLAVCWVLGSAKQLPTLGRYAAAVALFAAWLEAWSLIAKRLVLHATAPSRR